MRGLGQSGKNSIGQKMLLASCYVGPLDARVMGAGRERKQAQSTIAQLLLGCVLLLKENPVPSNSAQERQCH